MWLLLVLWVRGRKCLFPRAVDPLRELFSDDVMSCTGLIGCAHTRFSFGDVVDGITYTLIPPMEMAVGSSVPYTLLVYGKSWI